MPKAKSRRSKGKASSSQTKNSKETADPYPAQFTPVSSQHTDNMLEDETAFDVGLSHQQQHGENSGHSAHVVSADPSSGNKPSKKPKRNATKKKSSPSPDNDATAHSMDTEFNIVVTGKTASRIKKTRAASKRKAAHPDSPVSLSDESPKSKKKSAAQQEELERMKELDINTLPLAALKKYTSRYHLDIPPSNYMPSTRYQTFALNQNPREYNNAMEREELVKVVSKHYKEMELAEVDVIVHFLYSVKNRGRILKLGPEYF